MDANASPSARSSRFLPVAMEVQTDTGPPAGMDGMGMGWDGMERDPRDGYIDARAVSASFPLSCVALPAVPDRVQVCLGARRYDDPVSLWLGLLLDGRHSIAANLPLALEALELELGVCRAERGLSTMAFSLI